MGDTSGNELESIGSFIHKERSKEKLKTKGLLPNDRGLKTNELKENSKRQWQMQIPKVQQSQEATTKHRLKAQRINSEIDAFLFNLLTEGMISQEYWQFHAKACHILGIAQCNMLAINARNGNDKQKLYAYKIKGALQIYYKAEFERNEP